MTETSDGRTVFDGVAALARAKGRHLGYSDWHTITQDAVNRFADATGDHQWIHVDVDKAADSPFGGTVAHGYLTLALVPRFGQEIFTVEGVAMALNYGVDKVRFPAAVPVGSRVRGGVEIVDVAGVAQGVRVGYRYTIELEGSTKPACVANTLVLYVP